MSIDFRKEFEILEEELGFEVLLIRANKNTKCECYSPLFKAGDSKCKRCGGTGNVNTIEKVVVIEQLKSSSDHIEMSNIGLTTNNTSVFFTNHKTIPRSGDKYLLVGYGNGIPLKIKEVFVVATPRSVRGDRGRVEYFESYCKSSPELVINEQKRLNVISIKDKRKIMKGARYVWLSM